MQRVNSATLLCFSVIVLFSSCRYLKEKGSEAGESVARAYNYNLFSRDLAGIVPKGASKQDSISITRNYINNWVRQKAVLHKAETNLDEEKKNVEKQLEEYRNSLVVYAYETELIRQKLDTIVSEQEISEFYDKNQDNFELKDNIIKVIYLRVSKKSPKLNKVQEWYKSDNPKDRELLTEYCHQYAINYFLDDTTWLVFDDLLKEIPIKTYDIEHFLQNNRDIQIEDSTSIYYIMIKGFMIKNSASPLSFEKNNIRSMITNQRKLQLIEQMEKETYETALKNGDAEVH